MSRLRCAVLHLPRRQNRFWLGADLVVEIVSPDGLDSRKGLA
jgi:hypothetical protein